MAVTNHYYPASPSVIVSSGLATEAKQDDIIENTNRLDVIDTYRKDYSSSNVTTGSWVEIVASTLVDIKQLQIFDSSGQTMELGIGAAASETRKIIISPGGTDPISVDITSGSRLSIRAISANATVGELDINFLG